MYPYITWHIAAIVVPGVRTRAVVSAALEGSRTLVVIVAVALPILAEPSVLAAEFIVRVAQIGRLFSTLVQVAIAHKSTFAVNVVVACASLQT